ncbi:MAG: glutathione peroxidase [Gammaproteobacteria bacterium]|nr:glutathione peroxidase [Gammaproteobacteria bacterium]
MTGFHDFRLTALNGEPLPLEQFRGKAVLVVNVASECGLTPQYQGLQALYERLGPKGLVVLGLPCNQFGAQEPGTAEQIQGFCQRNYGVSFPLGAKLEVNGPGRHALYHWLAGETSPFPGDIQWNFEKFLIGKDGRLLARFAPTVTPEAPELGAAINQAL